MRVRVATICLAAVGVLAGCAHKPLPQPEVIAPNPFGYLKRSAVCAPGPVTSGPEGRSVSVAVRSDDGTCGIAVSRPQGGAYASFLLTTLPQHGKSFIYNYNKQTHVTYTADTAYAGPDAFAVSLVPGDGQPRSLLRVALSVDATGVARPVAPEPVRPETKSRSRRTTRHVVHHHASKGGKSAP